MKTLIHFISIASLAIASATHAAQNTPETAITLNLPPCSVALLTSTGDHSNNCSENGGLGGCNGIVGDVTNLGPIPSGQIFCGDHRIQACDRVSTTTDPNTFQQFACTTVPILLTIDGVDTWVAPGVGFPTTWRVAESCSEAQPGEFCEQYGCHWNIPYYDGGTSCLPAIAHHADLCNCNPVEECNNQADDDGDSLIDCFDPDCTCQPPYEDPTSIAFDKGTGGLDRLKASGFSPVPAGFNPATDQFCVMLATANGKIWSECLAPGLLIAKGNALQYKNRNAKATGGFAKIGLRMYATRIRFTLQAYGDMTGACTPAITGLQTTYGDTTTPIFFAVPWKTASGGCKAHFILELP